MGFGITGIVVTGLASIGRERQDGAMCIRIVSSNGTTYVDDFLDELTGMTGKKFHAGVVGIEKEERLTPSVCLERTRQGIEGYTFNSGRIVIIQV